MFDMFELWSTFSIRPIVNPHAVIVALSVPAKTSLRMYKINSFQYLGFWNFERNCNFLNKWIQDIDASINLKI